MAKSASPQQLSDEQSGLQDQLHSRILNREYLGNIFQAAGQGFGAALDEDSPAWMRGIGIGLGAGGQTLKNASGLDRARIAQSMNRQFPLNEMSDRAAVMNNDIDEIKRDWAAMDRGRGRKAVDFKPINSNNTLGKLMGGMSLADQMRFMQSFQAQQGGAR